MYAELKCKTNFSFLQGASHPEELVERAAQIGLYALGILDSNGVYAIPKAYWHFKKFPETKLLVGSEIRIHQHPTLSLIAQNRGAYGLLCRMLTAAHAGKEKNQAQLTLQELMDFAQDPRWQGLICLPAENSNYALLKEIFASKLYIPVSRFKDGHDKRRVQKALEISQTWSAPLVATNDVLYHEKSRHQLQDALTCVHQGKKIFEAGYALLSNGERYLKSPLEMKILFKDLPEALQNTTRIADSCHFCPSELRYRYPSEWIPQNHSAQSYLQELTWQGAKERYKNQIPENVCAQIHHELRLIEQLQFADYFLTIYDIVKFARDAQILCQGRGGAANSVVCYVLGITAVDPVKMDLLFERFISVERGEPPDIDVDFESERREEVIQYIYQKYGRDRAAMLSAVVTYRKRSMLREFSKVFGVNVGTLKAKEVEKNFAELAKDSPIPRCREQVENLAQAAQSFPRHLSIHSGGFTLSADPIIEIVPVEPARMDGRTIIQWDKYDLDYLGLLKVDILSLGMLSALKKTLSLVNMELHELPAEDPETYKMIQKADTVGTFQVESRAQMNMSGRLLPRSFYDLVIQVAIVRPGPILGKMVHPYLKRRKGLEPVSYPHEKLRKILQKTLGVPLFQEQVMKIAIEIGEFSGGEADQLRRAIGAWRSSGSLEKITAKLLGKFRQNGIPDAYAQQIFEQMKGFAHYGFPESHAASFALLTYASCYLKRHHPAEFTCGLLNSQPMGFYAAHTLIDDAKLHGVKVLPVDPNHSHYDCSLEGKALRLGLRVIRGLGKKEAEALMAVRPFHSLDHFLQNTHLSADILQRLAMAGAFAQFEPEPRQSLWKLLSYHNQKHSQQLSLFSFTPTDGQRDVFAPLTPFAQVQNDYEAYGLSPRAHPMAELRQIQDLPKMTSFSCRRAPPKTKVKTSGLLLVRQKPPTANGVCFAAIEDEFGFLDLVIFKEEFEIYKDVFLHHCFLIITGVIERDGHSISLLVKKIEPIWRDPTAANTLQVEPTQYFW